MLAVGLFLLLRQNDAAATTPRAALADTAAVGEAKAGVVKGSTARDFTATTADGGTVRLSDLRGKPVVINFWATWCTSCLVEMPELKAVQAEFGAENVAVARRELWREYEGGGRNSWSSSMLRTSRRRSIRRWR